MKMNCFTVPIWAEGDKSLKAKDFIVLNDVHRGDMKILKQLKGTVFVDLDGTVADIKHRRIWVTGSKKNWAAFERGIIDDGPVEHVIAAVRTLYKAGWTVVLMSGRTETTKEVTERWLAQHIVPYHALYMRRQFQFEEDGSVKLTSKGKQLPDSRRDDIVKKELLEVARSDGHDPDVVFDDRDQVVKMWRENGIPCVQVAEGNF